MDRLKPPPRFQTVSKKDLERVERMLRLTPTKHWLKDQKGSIEKLLSKANGERRKVQKEVAQK
jgi:hypothetical protein